jgi:diaminopimelate decarboxylase
MERSRSGKNEVGELRKKSLPFDNARVSEIAKEFPTPFYLYDEKGIRETAGKLIEAFSWAPTFKEYFAVKALPNPHILKIVKDEGFGLDCSSYAELLLAEKVGIKGADIMFTSNDTPAKEFQKARAMGAIINLDDISHIPFLEEHAGIPDTISFRYNPGPLRQGNEIIGKPEEAKFGLTRPQVLDAYRIMKDKGVRRFGLHTMVASNELNPDYFIQTADMLFDLVNEIYETDGIKMDFINMGGGIGIPYKPEQQSVNINKISEGVKDAYEEKISRKGLAPLGIAMESGRYITGPHGFLVTKAVHMKETYRNYVGLDASMADLMRPGMYGAYHHITVLGKENESADHIYDVTGSLCENNDKFAVQRPLPKIERGDLLVVHDAGAHGHAMGFNYNGKLRPAELLLKENGDVQMIRRAETVEDYFATLNFPK